MSDRSYEVHRTVGFSNQVRWVRGEILTGKKQRWPIVPIARWWNWSWQSPVTVHGVVFDHQKPGLSFFWWGWFGIRIGSFR